MVYLGDEGLMFELAQDEIECGMGVHGEVGYQRMKLRTASEVVTLMLKHICKDLSLTANDMVAVIINNFGALSQLEQAIVVYEVVNQLKHMNITPIRVYSGVLMTSLNSAGIHVSVLKLNGKYMFTLITYLDAETMAPCWPGRSYNIPSSFMRTSFEEDELKEHETSSVSVVKTSINSVMKSINEEVSLSFPYTSYNYDKICDETLFNNCLHAVSRVFTNSNTRNYLNELDRGCGDGDCGDTMHTFGNELVTYLESPCKHLQSALFQLANIMSCNVGGTTGALYCLFFTASAKILPSLASDPNSLDTQCIWFRVFCSGLDCLKKYGKVKAGDRSMQNCHIVSCAVRGSRNRVSVPLSVQSSDSKNFFRSTILYARARVCVKSYLKANLDFIQLAGLSSKRRIIDT
ncbi:triokinase/FMN cyclase-like [Pseudomyrmex gracilis]|uniref:triokinase/FMN cyclase-like n=1 Tax=Pseudomyrmex gracilis TaxID=219809 RepID=UPI0009957FAB|nr:triokinase/FMN cyclase-like [Pseudomyrmex gracilis]